MSLTLLIMAAGMGSRYGGNKQVDRIGPDGEILMEGRKLTTIDEAQVYEEIRKIAARVC